MANVHPSAVVDPAARLAESAQVGPLAYVGPDVELDDDVSVGPHVAIVGHTRVGARSEIHPFACLGGPPQHQSPGDEAARLEIGSDNVIREHATIHVGTQAGGGCTRVGDHNFIMNSAHIGHDCQIGSHCIISSFSGLAGHVRVDDFAVLGAYTGVHQFARVGTGVMTASNTKLSLDAPPFAMVAGDRARLVGVNNVGLKRRGYSRERQQQIKRAFHILFRSQMQLSTALEAVRAECKLAEDVEILLDFLESSDRGFCR